MGITFLCDKCGAIFTEPFEYKETHGLDTPPFEMFFVCPVCGHSNYAYTERCIECGKYVGGEYAKTKSGWICDSCYITKNVFED